MRGAKTLAKEEDKEERKATWIFLAAELDVTDDCLHHINSYGLLPGNLYPMLKVIQMQVIGIQQDSGATQNSRIFKPLSSPATKRKHTLQELFATHSIPSLLASLHIVSNAFSPSSIGNLTLQIPRVSPDLSEEAISNA